MRKVTLALATVCGAAVSVTSAQIIYTNGPLTTGATTQSNVAAPTGGQWSECANDASTTTTANTTAGFGLTGALRLADDFTIPSGQTWNVTTVRIPCYLTGATAVSTTAATLQIWNGPPNAGGTVIWGDTTTNRLASATFSDIYRTFSTIVPPACGGVPTVPGTTRRVQLAEITVATSLPAGTYWVDYQVTGSSFSPATTQLGTRQASGAGSNAIQFNAAWVAVNDAGQGCAATPLQQDMAFWIQGTVAGGASCYANCDNSTVAPCLNVNDFTCFLNSYSAGQPYANCDASTVVPILNVNDFTCFLNTYGAGCGAETAPRAHKDAGRIIDVSF